MRLTKSTPRTSQVLTDYEYWLERKYGVTGAYLVNAKSFLKTYTKVGMCSHSYWIIWANVALHYDRSWRLF
jgi:hypothetical protein